MSSGFEKMKIIVTLRHECEQLYINAQSKIKAIQELLASPVRLGVLIKSEKPYHHGSRTTSFFTTNLCSPDQNVTHQDHELADCHVAQQDIKAKICFNKHINQGDQARNLQH